MGKSDLFPQKFRPGFFQHLGTKMAPDVIARDQLEWKEAESLVAQMSKVSRGY